MPGFGEIFNVLNDYFKQLGIPQQDVLVPTDFIITIYGWQLFLNRLLGLHASILFVKFAFKKVFETADEESLKVVKAYIVFGFSVFFQENLKML